MSEGWSLVAAKLTLMCKRPIVADEAEQLVLRWLIAEERDWPNGILTPADGHLQSLAYLAGWLAA